MLVPKPTERVRGDELAPAPVTAQDLRAVAPIAVVTVFAAYGQVVAGIDLYSDASWGWVARLAVAVGVAAGLETISLYVNWHAHDALLMDATSTAARLRRSAYLIALGIGAINYSHFSDGWQPTPSAVVFALFSAVSPWLWGLHTRRAQRIQLLREGHADSTGATFSAERWRAFPLRTWQARRWSIDYSVTDPREAWRGFNQSLQDGDEAAPLPLVPLVKAGLAAPNPSVDLQSAASNASEPAKALNRPRVERVPLTLAPPLNACPTPPEGIPVVGAEPDERAVELIAAGHGRRRLSKELDISEYEARQLLDRVKP